MALLRFFLAVVLIPAVVALGWNFFDLVLGLGKNVSTEALPFWLGLGSYFIFQAIFSKPIKTYIFGHELSHAVAGILSGARVKSFKVSASGGSVVLTKTNVWITLAPYFLPLYTVFVLSVYWVGSVFWPLERFHSYLLFLSGFTLSFHFALTHYALMQGQSDLKQFGVFFSGLFIALINLILLSILLKILFPHDVQLGVFFSQGWHKMADIWYLIYHKAKYLWFYFMQMR